MPPCQNFALTPHLILLIASHLQERFGIATWEKAKSFVPEQIEQWGKIRRIDGGDTMHAPDVVSLLRNDRDSSFVMVSFPK